MAVKLGPDGVGRADGGQVGTGGLSALLAPRRLRVDPLVPAVALVSLVVYVLHGFHGPLNRDIALYTYAGQQVADGVPPYVGVLNRAGPLAHLLPGLGIALGRLVGLEDVFGARVLFLVFSVAAVCVSYLVGRDLFASRLAGLATSATMLSFLGFIHSATNGPREKTAMTLFLLCTLWSITRRWYLAAGAFLGLATLVWQPVLLVGLPSLLVITLTTSPDWRGRIRALGLAIAGGLATLAACFAYFFAVGAVEEFVQASFLINAEYTKAVPFSRNPDRLLGIIHDGYGVSAWFIAVGLVAIAGLSVAALIGVVRSGRSRPANLTTLAIGVGAVTGTVWTFYDINGWPDLFVLLPFAAVGIGGIAHLIVVRLPFRAALAATLGWVVLASSVGITYAVTHRSTVLDDEQASVDALLAELPHDATMLSIEAPQALTLSDRTNPTRYQMFHLGLDRYVDDTWPGGLEEFGHWIGEQQPTVLAIQGPAPDWLRPTMQDYAWVGRAPGWAWYVLRSVGDTTLHDARASLD